MALSELESSHLGRATNVMRNGFANAGDVKQKTWFKVRLDALEGEARRRLAHAPVPAPSSGPTREYCQAYPTDYIEVEAGESDRVVFRVVESEVGDERGASTSIVLNAEQAMRLVAGLLAQLHVARQNVSDPVVIAQHTPTPKKEEYDVDADLREAGLLTSACW